MRSCKDSVGRIWDVRITPWLMKLVAARTHVKLATLLDNRMALYGELTSDPVKFLEVLMVLVGKQLEERKMTEEDFFGGFQGDELEGAYEAFRGAFEDFCPSHLRTVLRAASAKTKVAQKTATEEALRKIEAIDPTASPDEPTTSSASATSAPASSESTPAG